MKKNNSLKVQIITALGAFAGAVLCCYYRKHRQVNAVIKAISDTLGDEEVTDFKSFSDICLNTTESLRKTFTAMWSNIHRTALNQ